MFSAVGIGMSYSMIHTNPALEKPLAESAVYLCGIHPSCSSWGEVLFKELPFPTLFLEGWPMTKITIQFFLSSTAPTPTPTAGQYMGLYGRESWNVIRASFSRSFLSLFSASTLPSIEVTVLSQNERLFLSRSIFLRLASKDWFCTHTLSQSNSPSHPTRPASVYFFLRGGGCILYHLDRVPPSTLPPSHSISSYLENTSSF